MNLLDAFKEYVATNDVETISKALGYYPSIVKRWKAGTHAPKLDVINAFHEKVFLQNPEEKGKAQVPKTSSVLASEVSGTSLAKQETPSPVKPVIKTPPKREVKKSTWNPDAPEQAIPLAATVEKVAEVSAVKAPAVKKNIIICFPCYKTTNPATAWALFAMGLHYGKEKLGGFMELGNALIYKTRNKLADQFVESGAEWSIWLDDDIIPPIGHEGWFRWITSAPASMPKKFAEQHFIERLTSHNKTLVGGLYFGRQKTGSPMFHEGLISREAITAARGFTDQLRPTDWVATGCMLVHRQVYLDIRDAYPELAPREPAAPEGSYWGYYNPIESAGEDVSFCMRAKKAGHQAHVDLGLMCAHVGYAAYSSWNTESRFLTQ